MSDSITSRAEYSDLLESIKATIAAGRLRAARAVNNVLVQTYCVMDVVGQVVAMWDEIRRLVTP